MSKNALIRIILWSIVLVLLIGILVVGLGASRIFDRGFRGDSDAPSVSSDWSNGEATSFCEYAAEDIRNLNIEWVSGEIILQPDDTADTVRVMESGGSDSKYQMVCRRSGSTLTVQFCKDSIDFPSFGISLGAELNKDLTILVPSDWICEELEIETAAADLQIRDMTIREVDFDGASGTCEFVNCTVDNLNMDTASGDVRFQGTLRTLDFDAASASFYGELVNTPRSMDMDGASGNLELVLPADAGFTVNLDGMSCDFTSDFAVETRNGSYVCGDGSCRISVDGMSTDVIIRKAQ